MKQNCCRTNLLCTHHEAKRSLFYHSNKELSQQGERFFSPKYLKGGSKPAHFPAPLSRAECCVRSPRSLSALKHQHKERERERKAAEAPKLEVEPLSLSFTACPDRRVLLWW